jgi:hypothetical protein
MQCAASPDPTQFAYALLFNLLDNQIGALRRKFSVMCNGKSSGNTPGLLQLSALIDSAHGLNPPLLLSRHLQSKLPVPVSVRQRFSGSYPASKRANKQTAHSVRCGHTLIGQTLLGHACADGVARFNIELHPLQNKALMALSQVGRLGVRIACVVEHMIHEALEKTVLSQAEGELKITVVCTANRLTLNHEKPQALGLNTFLNANATEQQRNITLKKSLVPFFKEMPI